MSSVAFEKPVEDSVPKINDEVAVGEDLEFQRRWWKFESIMWVFFTLILVLDLAGFFGRGPWANAQAGNGSMLVKYERVERTGTPSVLQVKFDPSALEAGKVKLFVSESIVEELGAQRVIPAPVETTVGDGGLTYTFSAGKTPASVEFALQPLKPGVFWFYVQVPGGEAIQKRVVVVP